MGGYRIEDFEEQRLAVLERSLAPNPSQSFNERNITRGMQIMFVPGERIAASVQPPVPQEMWPPRWGFYRTVPMLEDVLDATQMGPKRRQWMNGGVRPTPQAPRTDYYDDTWRDSSGIAPNRFSEGMP